MGLLGDGAHFGIYIVRQPENIFRVRAAKIVGLVENFDAHAVVISVFGGWLFGSSCHFCTFFSDLLALLRCRGCLACCLLRGESVNLLQHFLHAAADIFALFAQADHLAAHVLKFFFALF